MSHRNIFLGMPGYGQQTAAAGRSYWLACRDDTDGQRCADNEFRDKVIKEQQIGSLLANNFNKLWARALTLRHRGQQIDYFAMLHDDIGCEDFWLDKLIDEMEATNLDMLGVVSPIKDCRGMTSIALAHPSGDPWQVLCRLSMDEVYQLPPTFTSEDVGHPLLLNTGCWVCRFDKFAEYPFYFTINDQITFDPRVNAYVADCESEDWFFSRLCHQAGLRIGATRRIALFHEGNTRYVNTMPWGRDKHDVAVAKSQLPARKDGFRFPHDVDGWLTAEEGGRLFEIAKGKRVLEIGSYCGRSTICLAQSAEYVLSIDPHDGRGTPKPRETFIEMRENLVQYGVKDRVSMFRGTSDCLSETDGQFDVAFIDGAHDYDAVRADIDAALRVLSSGGVLVFHDYRDRPSMIDQYANPDVHRAVNELLADGGELLSLNGTLAVVKPPAAIPLEV